MTNNNQNLSPDNPSKFQKDKNTDMTTACQECFGQGHFGDMPKGHTTFVPCNRCAGSGYEIEKLKKEEYERILGDKNFVIKETTDAFEQYEKALKLLADAGSRTSNIKSLSEVRGFAIRVLDGKKNP